MKHLFSQGNAGAARCLKPLLVFVVVAGLSGCVNVAGMGVTPSPAAYTDPFAYCAAVGTVDAPGETYTGPAMPEVIVQGLKEALNAPADAPDEFFAQGASWRCMNGQVYACTVGANLPCQEKADTSRTPSQAMEDYCRENPGSEFIPMVVTGRATVYEWACNGISPEVVQQVAEPDEAGYLAHIWYEIEPD